MGVGTGFFITGAAMAMKQQSYAKIIFDVEHVFRWLCFGQTGWDYCWLWSSGRRCVRVWSARMCSFSFETVFYEFWFTVCAL